MTDAVRKVSAEAAVLNKHCDLIDDLIGGTDAMRAAGERRLPKWPNEDPESYKTRLAVATLFPAYQRTVEVLGAKPFSKPLTLGEDVPVRSRAWCESVDRGERNLHSFLSEVGQEALGYGFSGILVDYPETKDKYGRPIYVTKADEDAAGVRPYFIQIHPRNILGWSKDEKGLSQLRLLELVSEQDGEFATKDVEQVRVLRRGSWQTWRQSDDQKKEWRIYAEGATTLKTIPFVPVYGNRLGFMRARPALLEIAHANVEHWQTKSDRQVNLHMLSVPILFAKMLAAAVLTVGAGAAVKAEHPDADMKFVEMSGVAVEAGRQVLLDLEDQMRQAGAELLIIKPGGISVAQTLADNEQGTCVLQKVAQNIEDAADQALQLMAEWVGEAQGGHVTIYKDFGATTLAEASAELLFKSASAGKLSGESYFRELQRRGILSPDLKWEEEVERIAAQGPVLGAL
ncbi:MAG: DUF4055 domain-containing protein [Pseudomonadota bacterium]